MTSGVGGGFTTGRLARRPGFLLGGETRVSQRVILDVGCGAGGALVLAAEVVGEENVTGADPTSALAGTARRRLPGARIEVVRQDRSVAIFEVNSVAHYAKDALPIEQVLALRATANSGFRAPTPGQVLDPSRTGYMPDRVRSFEIDASAGKVSPLLRRPVTSPRSPIRRDTTGPSPNSRTFSACDGRNRSGMSRSSGWPITSSARP